MKKLFLTFCSLFTCLCAFSSSFFNSENYAEYTLKNGITIYAMEDFSSSRITLEYSVLAGISSQNQENTGFMTLYSRLFKMAGNSSETKLLSKLNSECNSDFSRFKLSVAPSELESTLSAIKNCAFNPVFSDKNIKAEYEKLREEVINYSQSPASLINASIDSRVFSSVPWKQDSGIYPALFKRTTPEQVRTILNSISKTWYVPQNSSLFITGCIKKQEILDLCKNLFSEVSPAPNPARLNPVPAGGSKRKFVIYDKDFSTDITQIVVEYTSLSMNQSDILGLLFDREGSSCKKLLLRQRNLGIRGDDYINVSSAHKNGSSRLIFQSLLEKPVNKKVTAADQADLFAAKVKEGLKISDTQEFLDAKNRLITNLNQIGRNSETFMDYLSQFRALENFDCKEHETNSLAHILSNVPQTINDESIKGIQETFSAEAPFIFVLVHTDVYNENKKAFDRLGYESISAKNGSWYSQKLYSQSFKMPFDEKTEITKTSASETAQKFIKAGKDSIQSFELKNGIPVTVKSSQSTSTVLLMISVKGGKFHSFENAGFEEVMLNAFASNIQKEISKYKAAGAIEGDPEILAESFNSWGTISVECAKEDAGICLKCISEALIFGEITPAEADSYVYSVQTQKRLFNASAVNQLYFRGIKYLYEDKVRRSVFNSEDDILESTNYTHILASYPKFLNASLYRITIVGNIDADYLRLPLENTMGLLTAQKFEEVLLSDEKPDFPENKQVNLKLRHLFYTDVKAEDAGPMPAVLIPTTNFSDPVVFFIRAPEIHGRRSQVQAIIFDALIYRLKDIIEENAEDICAAVKLFPRALENPSSAIALTTVDHTLKAEELFKLSKIKLQNELSEKGTQKIVDAWMMNELEKTGTNRGTALLLLKNKNPAKYLEDYEALLEATKEDFIEIENAFIPALPPLRIYSADAKK